MKILRKPTSGPRYDTDKMSRARSPPHGVFPVALAVYCRHIGDNSSCKKSASGHVGRQCYPIKSG
jgi:hypothetical protein